MAILPPGFILDRSGNFGIMTALLMVPLVGAAGMAVDVAHALSLRTQLYAAADAAAVGSIAEKSGAVAAAMTMSGNGTISLGSTDARNIFMSQMSGELTGIQVDLGIDVTKARQRRKLFLQVIAEVSGDVGVVFDDENAHSGSCGRRCRRFLHTPR